MKRIAKAIATIILLAVVFSLSACNILSLLLPNTPETLEPQGTPVENEEPQDPPDNSTTTPTTVGGGGEQGDDDIITPDYIKYVKPSTAIKRGYNPSKFFSTPEEERNSYMYAVAIKSKPSVTVAIDLSKIPAEFKTPENYGYLFGRNRIITYAAESVDEMCAFNDALYKGFDNFSAPCLPVVMDLSDVTLSKTVNDYRMGRMNDSEGYLARDAVVGANPLDRSDITYNPVLFQKAEGTIETNNERTVQFELSVTNNIPTTPQNTETDTYRPNQWIRYLSYGDHFLTNSKMYFTYSVKRDIKGTYSSLEISLYYLNRDAANPYIAQGYNNNGTLADLGVAYIHYMINFNDKGDFLTETEIDDLCGQFYDILKDRIYVYDYIGYKLMNESYYAKN